MTRAADPPSESDGPDSARLSDVADRLLDYVPHCKAIGMRFADVKAGEAVLRVPYDERLVGNPDTGVLHGGVITTLLDNASGMAVQSTFSEWMSIATLDLRIDYMRPATPGEDLFAWAHCYRRTRNIAFVRGIAYHEHRDEPIATSVGTFMLASDESRRAGGGSDRT